MKHTARKRFGQNFLHDQDIIGEIIDAVDPTPEDTIVEIGPGRGALTKPLLHSGCRLHLIELDRDLVAYWRQQQARYAQMSVHEADALTFDFGSLEEAPAVRLVGNLPYNISTPLLFHFLEHRSCFENLHVMLQKEVADRICAPPGSKTYGRLSVMLAVNFRSEILFEVPPEAFDPQPRVTSAFMRIEPHDPKHYRIDDRHLFAGLVRQAFSQRRKTLRRSLHTWLDSADFVACGIDSGLRPEALSAEEFAGLANQLARKAAPDH